VASSELNNSDNHTGGRILVMDDEEIVLDMVQALLEKLGYEADLARDGRETILKYRESLENNRPYKLVLIDLVIPGGMGGQETIHVLKELDPQVKAIVSSGHFRDPVMQNYTQYGFQGALTKPYVLKELEDVLSQVSDQQLFDRQGNH
jgi:CheY-like chemotaxis protein